MTPSGRVWLLTRAHVWPPSAALSTPEPRYEESMSPMPAYTTEGLLGAKASQPTARSVWSSLTGAKFAPPSVERQMPPVEEPTRTTRVSAGETATAFMRPLDTPHLEVVAVGLGPIAA